MTTDQSTAGPEDTDSPFQLLGRAIAAACAAPGAPTVELQALVVYAVEHARLEGVAFLELSRALDGWIDLNIGECDERVRWRVAAMVRQWALAEFLACEARANVVKASPAR
jgi:hypothetical protein